MAEAIDRGAVPLHRGKLTDARFLPGQDTAAYVQPVTLLNPPPSSPLHHAEPFGPVDTIVLVDTEAELLAAMNASNGALVATLSTDDEATYARLAPQIRAFKVGRGKPRSAATATSSSAASARPGAAPSSAASCSCAPSHRDRRGSGSRATSRVPARSVR